MSLHDARKIKNPNKRPFRFRLFYQNNKKIIGQLLLLTIIIVILFFPSWSGTLIGNWIKDFIGTILNIIKTI